MKSFESDMVYDEAFDLLDFSAKRNYDYKRTVELDNGFYMDFDEDDVPVSIEIIGASKKFDIKKKFISTAKIDVTVDVGIESIKTEINVGYIIRERKHSILIEKTVSNQYGICESKTLLSNNL